MTEALWIRSDELLSDLHRPPRNPFVHGREPWEPTPAQRKAVIRAMHSFVRKRQQYALMGGQGRRELYLYDATDPLSVMWTKLNVERRRRNPICRADAVAALNQNAATP